ncbi:hypothetical protein AeNC1_002964 [Aphanomyces euteiches]|nr:hypothetical protein AeNC1_002964 [Aphanomyces euteiches]
MARRILGYMWSAFVAQWPTIIAHAEGAIQRIANSELTEIIRDLSSFSLRMFLRFMQLSTALVLLLTSASAIYACFYYLLMPTKILHRPLYFDYGVHSLVLRENEHERFLGQAAIQLPAATLDLSTGRNGRDQWTYTNDEDMDKPMAPLTPGAKYDFVLEFDFAQSDTNVDIGMFMVRTQVLSGLNVTAKSVRPTLVRQGHWVVDFSSRIVWMVPTLALGHDASLTQTQLVLAINGYQDLRDRPLTSVHVELSHPRVQVVRASLSIIAQLSGLRYLMYHWFALTSTIAIINIACFEVFFCFMFYLYLTFPSGDSPPAPPADDEEEDDDEKSATLEEEDEEEEEDDATSPPQIYEAQVFTADSTAHLRQRHIGHAAKAI